MDPPQQQQQGAQAGAQAGAAAAAGAGLGGAGLQQQQLQDVLANQERIRKSTDIPPFYAEKERDVLTAEMFMQRFEVAAAVARWRGAVGAQDRDHNICRNFFLHLRGKATQWWKSLDNCIEFDKQNWDSVRERFLESYARQYTPTSACTGLTEMRQKPGESVQDYFVRCNVIYDRIKEIKPVALDDWRGAVPAGLDLDTLRRGKEQGVKEMGLFFLHLLFVVGLREDIRMKTIEAGDDNLEAARITAKAKELLLNDKRQVHKVFGVKGNFEQAEEEDTEEEDYDSEVQDILQQINVVRRQNGKRPYKFGKRFNFKNIQCHYCHKKGHFQKICKKRQRDGAPMIQKKLNEITLDSSEEEEETETEEKQTNSITFDSFYGLNSLKTATKIKSQNHLNY